MNDQIVFTVAGMHRSGSSLFANWLAVNDVFIGNRLLEGASTNPKGHFEDLDFLELHAEELAKNKLHISGLYGDLSKLNVDESFNEKAKALVRTRASYPVWAWKEPRTTLFLMEWKKIVPQLKVIILKRDHEKIIKSLYKRLKLNKWYYTRNPLKKLWWYAEIDLQPKKWEKHFKNVCEYYDKCSDEFYVKYPESTLQIEIENFLNQHKSEVDRINSFLNTNFSYNALETIFNQDLMHH